MSSHEKLAAAANDRKSRLAQLKSLKRKQAPDDSTADINASEQGPSTSNSTSSALTTTSDSSGAAKAYLSGRNYDPETRNAKLGFQDTPIADPTSTLEYKASQLALQTKLAQESEQTEDKPLDLFKLQPKKANWDLKRDLELKMRPVHVWTENAIAKIVRERVEGAKKSQQSKARHGGVDGGEEVGMEGEEFVEVIALKERDEEEARKREAEEDAADVS